MKQGLRLLITRPLAQARVLCDALRLRSCVAEVLPLIATQSNATCPAVVLAWEQMQAYEWIFFVSPNAVEHFFAAQTSDVKTTWPRGLRVAAAGPGTLETLLQMGVPLSSITAPASDALNIDSEALWEQLQAISWADKRVLIVRGDGGRAWLANQLVLLGAQVNFVEAYARTMPNWQAAEQSLLTEALNNPDEHIWLFSSSLAIDHLLLYAQEHMQELGMAQTSWSKSNALVTHPRIAQRAHKASFRRILTCRLEVDEIASCIKSLSW